MNRIEVDKINLRSQLEEIRTHLISEEFDCELKGLSNVVRIFEEVEWLKSVKDQEFLGPIFQWIKFKEDACIFAVNYFRVSGVF